MAIAEKYMPHYTYEEYAQWEGKWELIEGIPYAMSPAPIPQHQMVNTSLCVAFSIALKKGCQKCKVCMPIDWKIAEDTIIQPDVLIICEKIEKKYLDFPPVLVAEILSPSTTLKDRGLKFEIYQSQKVKYYLIIDPKFKKMEIYELMNNKYEPISINPNNYKFVWDDGCSADTSFEEIWD
jgi:Uma2 family endonuclease